MTVATPTAILEFAPSLQATENFFLRERVSKVLASLNRPAYAATLFGIRSGERPASTAGASVQFIVFDLQRIFLYTDPTAPRFHGVDSLVRFVIDDYPFAPLRLIEQHFASHSFEFLYPLETLEILPLMLADPNPGKITVLDLQRGEIRNADVRPHPQASPPRLTAETDPTRQPVLRFESRPAGKTWRSEAARDLTDLTSPDVGIVRGERLDVAITPLPSGTARISWWREAGGKAETLCGGKSFRSAEALHIARCETLERFHIIYPNPDEPLVYSSFNQVKQHAIDPDLLFFRLLRKGKDELRDYDPSLPMYWCWAANPLTSENRLVPAQEIWFTDRLPNEPLVISNTTNGCALGGSVEEASLFALLEAVERDAFLTTWYLRRRCSQVRLNSIRHEAFHVLWERVALTYPDHKFHLFNVSADPEIPTMAVFAVRQRGAGPRAVLALSARPLAEQALFSALREVAIGLIIDAPADKMERCRQLLERPQDISTPDDHRRYFAMDEAFAGLSFLGFDAAPTLDVQDLNREAVVKEQPAYDLREVLESMLRHLQRTGVEVFFKDITHAQFARRGVRCVKAVTPGLFPMWYGHLGIRFALTDRFKDLAQRLVGWVPQSHEDVNLNIHPFG